MKIQTSIKKKNTFYKTIQQQQKTLKQQRNSSNLPRLMATCSKGCEKKQFDALEATRKRKAFITLAFKQVHNFRITLHN